MPKANTDKGAVLKAAVKVSNGKNCESFKAMFEIDVKMILERRIKFANPRLVRFLVTNPLLFDSLENLLLLLVETFVQISL